MFLRIETSSGLPITRQIMDQIRRRCAAGTLRPGDRLPSVRELARDLAVNQNTILRVYERLESEGLLERRHGAGTYVARFPAEEQRELGRRQIEEEVERLVRHAATLRVAPEALRALVDEAFSKIEAAPAEAAAADVASESASRGRER